MSNSISGNTITTTWTAEPFDVIQKTTYMDGNSYYRLEWNIYNRTGSSVSDLRFFHGQDTYLSGGDKGGGFWDSANNAIGVVKTVSGEQQRMTLQGVTAPYAYESRLFSEINTSVSNNALTNAINPDENIDNGYGLEWRTASLGAYSTWTIVAFEKFNNASVTGVSVTAPAAIECQAGTTCAMNFSVQNMGASSSSVSLSASSSSGWTTWVSTPSSPVTIGAGATQSVTVQVAVPAGVGGSMSNVTLTANDGTNTSSDIGGVTATVPPYIAPTAFTSGYPVGATYGSFYSHTFTANGSPEPSYSIVSGSIPSGMSLNSGVLSGTPNAAGGYTFSIRASNPGGTYDSTYTINVAKAGTSLTITGNSPNPSVYGQSYTVSVRVDSLTSGIPEGVVVVTDGVNSPCNITLSGGTGSCVLPSSSVTPKTITATYSETSNFYQSSASVGHTTNTATTNTSASINSSTGSNLVYGQPFTLGATVTSQYSGAVAGSIQFQIDGINRGTGIDTTGSLVSTPSIQDIVVSETPHAFTANYSGDGNNYGSTGSGTFTVSKAPTTVSISSSDADVVYGTTVDVTITVEADLPSLAMPEGTVIMYIDGIQFGDPMTLDTNGQAVKTVPYMNLWPGDHQITASYTSDVLPSQFLDSNSQLSPFHQIVRKAPPVFTLTSSKEAPVTGEPVGLNVTVSPSMDTQGIPSGRVQFLVGGNPLGGLVTLDGEGKATSPAQANLNVNNYEISVTYSGDDYFLPNPSTPIILSVTPAQTTTRITGIGSSTAVVGEPVAVSVVVEPIAPATGVPTGNVRISNGTDICEATLDSAGEGSCLLSTSFTSDGISLTASYLSDSNYQGSDSSPFAGPVVDKAESAVQLDSFSPISPVVGQQVQFNFSASPVFPGDAPLSGMVTVRTAGGQFLCATDITFGHCSASFSAAGATSLMIEYAGDANLYGSSAGPVDGPVVEKSPTTSVVASSSATSVYGQPVHFTASVAAQAPGAGLPSGMVQFQLDGSDFGAPVALVEGSAQSEDVSDLVLGTHEFSVQYLGSDDFSGSAASIQTQTVTSADTLITLESDLPVAPYGVSVWITATVVGKPLSEVHPISGTMQFVVDNVPYGDPIELDSNGQARKQLPYTALWVGSHTIRGVYSGNDSFNGSATSTDLTQVITKGNVTFQVTPSVSSPVFGQSLNFEAQITGVGANNPRPGGTLTFNAGGLDLGTITLSNARATSNNTAGLPVGTHDITLTYSGDAYYAPVTAYSNWTITIGKADANAAITLILPDISVVVGQPVDVGFSVTAAMPGAGTPTGNVMISSGDDSCSARVVEGSCTLTPSTTGATVFTIAYEGDGNFNEVLSGTGMVGPEVSKAAISLLVTTPAGGNVVVGEPYQVSAQVTPVHPGTYIPVGEMLTLSNGNDECEAVIQSDGTATCDIVPTTMDSQQLTALYAGGLLFDGPITSASVNGPTVGVADVGLAVDQISDGFVVVGEPYTVFVEMNASLPSTTIPVGAPVTISNGTDTCGTTIEQDGTGFCQIVSTAIGSPLLTASFNGNSFYNPAASADFNGPVVSKANFLLTIPLPPTGPYLVGEPYMVVALASADDPSTTIPVGDTLTITNGRDECEATIQNDGSAECILTPTFAGTPDLRALYNEGSLYLQQESIGAAGPQVNKGNILITIPTPPAGPYVVSQSFPVTAQVVSVMPPGTTIPVGEMVTISNGTDDCSAEILIDGSATCNLVPGSTGAPSLSAAFFGNNDYNSSFSPDVAGPQVNKANVNLSIPVPPSGTVVTGEPYEVIARVEPVNPATILPAGENLTLSNGKNSCTAVIQNDGTAACNIVPTTIGNPDVAATYGGSEIFLSAVSPLVTSVTVIPAETTVTIQSPINPSVSGSGIAFTANVGVDAPGGGTPTGQVIFELDGNPFGSPVEIVNGKAVTPAVTDLAIGSHILSAVYSGDSNYNESPTASYTQTVVEASIITTLDPDSDQTLTFDGAQGGLPITTTVEVPAGAVEGDSVLVYRQFTDSDTPPPTAMRNLLSFTLEVYQNGVLVPEYTFDEPLVVTLTYYPDGIFKPTIKVLGWNGTTWSTNGLVMMNTVGKNTVSLSEEIADTIQFQVFNTRPLEFALVGSSAYITYIPYATTNYIQPPVVECTIMSAFPSYGADYRLLADFDGKWVIRNDGDAWEAGGVELKYLSGYPFQTKRDALATDSKVEQGESVTMIIDMRAPEKTGRYSSTWGLVKDGVPVCTSTLTIDVDD